MTKAVYPGSFDPITNGHIDVLDKALKVFDEVIVLVANNENKKSRFSLEDRVEMVQEALKGKIGVKVESTTGHTVEFMHKVRTLNIVRGLRNEIDKEYEEELISAYKMEDPHIKMNFFVASEEYKDLSSSKIEEMVKNNKDISNFVPNSVIKMYKKR